MTLSKQREAIVEEFEKKFPEQEMDWGGYVQARLSEGMKDWLTQALNDYTNEIVRMVEGKKKTGKNVMMTRESQIHAEGYDKGYNRALNDIKELLTNDTK